MNYASLGARLDREDKLTEAAWAYEIALQLPDVSVELVLDLIAIYFTCLDAGYCMSKGLDQGFVDGVDCRVVDVLARGRQLFGPHAEFDAWSLALRQQVGDEVPREQFEPLAFEGSDIAVIEASLGHDERFAAMANQVYDRVKDGATARKRYLRSFDHRKQA